MLYISFKIVFPTHIAIPDLHVFNELLLTFGRTDHGLNETTCISFDKDFFYIHVPLYCLMLIKSEKKSEYTIINEDELIFKALF